VKWVTPITLFCALITALYIVFGNPISAECKDGKVSYSINTGQAHALGMVAWLNGGDMRMIENWRKAYRMLSVQAMALATAIQGTWMTIPDDMKASIPVQAVHWITMGLLAFGIFGRLVDQPKVHE